MRPSSPHRPALKGRIRQLRPSEQPLFRDHLLRLDTESRHDRFNGLTTDEFVTDYAARSFREGTTVVGYIRNGAVLGAAELHERPELQPPTGEIAFSVERFLQNRGIGSRLFERLLDHARALGYERLLVTTHSGNAAMKALARKFDAALSFSPYETVGVIELDGTAEADAAEAWSFGPDRRSTFGGPRSQVLGASGRP